MPFIKTLEKYGTLSEACKADWNAATQTKNYPAGKELLELGDINNKLFFIEKGLARVYYFSDVQDITSRFAWEGNFLCSVGSFFSQIPATEQIELLEDSVVRIISYQHYRQFLDKHPDLGNLFREIYEQRFVVNDLRTKLILETNYTKRYSNFLNAYPEISARVQVNHVASFLGMSYSKLCHIRGELAHESKK